MSTIEILMYSIGSVFFLSALAFTYYAIKNSRLMQGPVGHQLMAAGGALFMAAAITGAVNYFFFLSSGLVYGAFFVWVAGLLYIVGGGWLRAKDIQRTYRVSLSRIFTMMAHSKFCLVAIVALVFISTPFFILGILNPLELGFVWSDVVNMCIWAFAFLFLAVGERMLYLGVRPSVAIAKVEHKLLRGEVRTLKARLDLTNNYLMSAAMISGTKPLETILSRCAEENPVLLDGYKLDVPGKLRLEPLIENLNRINPREREQAIFKAFCSIDAGAVILYARMTSPEQATKIVTLSFKEGFKFNRELLYDYALPALLFGNVLEPLLMKCKKGTREAVGRKMKVLGKDEPLIGKLEIEHDGRVNLTQFYQALVQMSREKRIERTVSTFSTTLKSSHPIIWRDLGDRTREMVAGALATLLKKRLVRAADVRELSKELGR